MPYEINSLLMKCKIKDFEFFIAQIDSYVNFTSDEELRKLLSAYKDSKVRREKRALAYALEREIRYLGSSDAAYAYRKLFTDEEPAGVSIIEIIQDVSKNLKISYSYSKDPIRCFIHLAEEIARKGLTDMPPKTRNDLLISMDIPTTAVKELTKVIQNNPKWSIKILYDLLESSKVKEILITFINLILGKYIGEGAAIAILTTILPGLVTGRLATLLAATAGGLIAGYSIQTPAIRKTIPIIIYLAQIAIQEDISILKITKSQ